MSSHIELKNYIEQVYNFKTTWKQKCSKYYLDQNYEQPSILPPVKRIIVIGDIHGDWDITINSLKIARLIDHDNNWVGGDTVVVQVGDQIDRCRYAGIPCNQQNATIPDEGSDWRILKFFTKLHTQALKYGGAVYSLLGNHELMNVEGDFRYVSYEGLREFDNFKKPTNINIDIDGDLLYDTHNEIIEDGNIARRWLFKPGNPMSEFLACTRQIAIIIGSNIFVHAGILPKIAKKYSVNNLNQLMTLYLLDKLDRPSEYKDIFNSSDFSPLWNRVYGRLGLEKYSNNNGLSHNSDLISSKNECAKLLNPIKEIYQVDKIFIGHTPLTENGIGNVCDGKIWLTDYGSSKAFDKFDKQILDPDPEKNNIFYTRSSVRQAQVLEIIDDGRVINILK
jgi:hypothetical protein